MFRSSSTSSVLSQRSGRNSYGRWKLEAENCELQKLTPTDAPAGTYFPETIPPPSGASRQSVDGTGGNMRRPSSSTALRYLHAARALRVRSSWFLKTVLSSVVRL